MLNLGNIFCEDGTCRHRSPDIAFIADFLDREGMETRAYFCDKCCDYKWKTPETKTPSRDKPLEEGEIIFYCTSELLTEFRKIRGK